eukprot:TRINITY_DN2973_c0_g1_i1.p3 TRINITY_DN2973_c0_g1~~TRINITY_DN2973_c0_g1_i1.p3  ORF type:complete len:127 (+),score=20.56 TRINITY_DN2973_c0_g1_i1:1018-1398(+)
MPKEYNMCSLFMTDALLPITIVCIDSGNELGIVFPKFGSHIMMQLEKDGCAVAVFVDMPSLPATEIALAFGGIVVPDSPSLTGRTHLPLGKIQLPRAVRSQPAPSRVDTKSCVVVKFVPLQLNTVF